MKILTVSVDSCSGTKQIKILQTSNGRALFGIYTGYISVFYRNFETDYQIVNCSYLKDSIFSCDIEKLTNDKFDNFFNEPLSFRETLYYKYYLPIKCKIIKVNVQKQLESIYGKEK